ncbi:MAG TPA: PilN domain-containing protein [Gemmatimonadales bacterium]|nr:PilN domain-containing protein [Gemmatimonadales bacterium]
MSGSIIGVAVSDRHLVVARCGAPTADGVAWRRELSEGMEDTTAWRDEVAAALLEMRETLDVGAGRLAVVLLPPLVQLRVIQFPRLRAAEVRRVGARDVARYFPRIRGAQTVALELLRGPRRGPISVLAAATPAWVPEALTEAAGTAGFAIASFEPAHAGWARWARSRGSANVIVLESGGAELIRTHGRRVVAVRRTPAVPARIDAALTELGDGGRAVFGEGEVALACCREGGVELVGSVEAAAAIAAAHAGPPGGLELVTIAEASARGRRVRQTAIRLWLATAASLLLALGLHRAALVRELRTLESARISHRGAVEAAMTAREAALGVSARLAALTAAEHGALHWTAVLDQIATTLPPDAYLTGLRTTGDSLAIEGVARRAAGVFEGLQAATRLSRVRPSGPIRQEVRDSAPPIERFSATAMLRAPADSTGKRSP